MYALQNHVERDEGHLNARRLASYIRELDGLSVRPEQVDTNIVIFQVDPRLDSAFDICGSLRESGVLMLGISPCLVRAVTHLDVTQADVDRAGEQLASAVQPCAGATR